MANDNLFYKTLEANSEKKHDDIQEIIKSAMAQKDRCISIFITDTSTSVQIYPYTDDGMKWIENGRDLGGFKCSACGGYSEHPNTYCPHCGEKRTGFIFNKKGENKND